MNSCQDAVDCVFAEWSDWSACSCSCEGVQTAHRRIQKYGRGDGKWCKGALKLVRACNNYTDASIPNCQMEGANPTNCVLGAWSAWGACSATCGGGQQSQKRTVVQEAKNGGTPCSANLETTRACNTQPCEVSRGVPCQWGQWSNWGACDKCGGQQKRSRNIKVISKDGGTPCRFDASEETKDCPRQCHSVKLFCEWGEWQPAGACSSTCGPGYKQHKRVLQLKKVTDQKLYEAEHPSGDGQYRLQDVILSFAGGAFVTFVMLIIGMRAVRRPQPRTYSRELAELNHEPMVGIE